MQNVRTFFYLMIYQKIKEKSKRYEFVQQIGSHLSIDGDADNNRVSVEEYNKFYGSENPQIS